MCASSREPIAVLHWLTDENNVGADAPDRVSVISKLRRVADVMLTNSPSSSHDKLCKSASGRLHASLA